jgi:hypothetical protein
MTVKRTLFGMVVAALLAGLVAVPSPAAPPAAQPKKDAKKEPVKKPGVLHVYDGGSLFTATAIDAAKVSFGKLVFDPEATLTVDTHAGVPAGKKLPEGEAERPKFFEQWAKDAASADKARGVYVLVCRSPGYVQVIADKQTRDRGFGAANEQRLRDMFTTAFKDAAQAKRDGKSDDEVAKIRDKGLSNAADYVSGVLKGTVK